MLNTHPEIHGAQVPIANGYPFAAAAPINVNPHLPPILPHAPAPGYAQDYPAIPGVHPGHGYLPPVHYQHPMMAPLPYYGAGAENRPPAPQRAPRHEVDTSHIDISVPRNTEVPEGIVTRVIIRLPTNLAFQDFFDRVCANMDLQPAVAVLGYKFSGDRVSDVPNRLANPEDLAIAMTKAIEKLKRARTREVVVEIHNLMASTARSKKESASKSKKRTLSNEGENTPDTTISYASQLRQFKNKLFCQKHDHFCYINPIDSEHIAMNTQALTLWAKKILFNEANYTTLPSIKMFDHVPKKLRATPSKPTVPPINIYISPFSDATEQHLNRGTPSHSLKLVVSEANEDQTVVSYPLISDILADLDKVAPTLDYPQYTKLFHKNGIVYVNGILGLDTSYFIDIIGMPQSIVQAFLDHAHSAARKAEKGKGRAVVKSESKEDEFSSEKDYIVLSD